MGLVETEWRKPIEAHDFTRPMRYHRLTDEGLRIAPDFYVQHDLPLITSAEELKKWLREPLSQLALNELGLEQIPEAELEATISVVRGQ